MLFCQQKNAKRVTTVAGIVVAAHCYVVWFVCLKTVIHHFAIPLSAPVSSLRIKLNKSMPIVKSQTGKSVAKSNNKKPIQALPKTSQAPAKQATQKASVQKVTNKSESLEKNTQKKGETKKPIAKEVQKTTVFKEVEPVKKSNTVAAVNNPIQKTIAESNVDQRGVIEQPGTMNTIDYYDIVYETMIEQWRPPIGIVKGTSCTVAFTIDKKGVPVDIVFEKKSEVLMFEMSIKTVLARVAFSPLLVGNRFSIRFTV